MSLKDYLAKSETVLHPGAHGSTHWYIGRDGQVVYGEKHIARARRHETLGDMRKMVSTHLMGNDTDWSFLTAFHSSRSHLENLKLNAQLFEDLHKRGARVFTCRGYYTYQDENAGQGVSEEPSFLALGLSTKDAILLGHKYDQESILSNEGFYNTDNPTMVPVTSKTVVNSEIKKDQDQSVIYLPDRNLTFLVQGNWDNPEAVPSHRGYYDHLGTTKSYGGGQVGGGYAPPTPPTNNMVLIAAEVDLESHLGR